jgi:AcrR family transcriptional regulator
VVASSSRHGDRGGSELSDIGRRRMERRLSSGRKSDARWQAILRGAANCFQKLGYAQTTLEDVANEVGINRATLYYYVGTKEELLIAILYGPIHQMTASMKAIASLDLSPHEKLHRVLIQYTTDMTGTPELFIFLAQNLHHLMTGREAADIAANADDYGKGLTKVIEEGIAAGAFRSDIDPQMAMLAILGMFNWIHRWYDPDGPKTLIEIGEMFASLALASLRPQPGLSAESPG